MHLKFKYLIHILFIGLLISCEKEEESGELITYFVNQEMVEKFASDANSYWVYRNEQSDIDSVWVESLEHKFYKIPCPMCGIPYRSQHEIYTMELKSSIFEPYNYFFMSDHFKRNGDAPWNGQAIFIYDKEVGHEFNGITKTNFLDSLLVGGQYFYDVEQFSLSQENQFEVHFDSDVNFYFAANIGLVKKEILGDNQEIWELDSWEIQ